MPATANAKLSLVAWREVVTNRFWIAMCWLVLPVESEHTRRHLDCNCSEITRIELVEGIRVGVPPATTAL